MGWKKFLSKSITRYAAYKNALPDIFSGRAFFL